MAGLGVEDLATRWDEFFRTSRGQLDKFIPDDPLGADGGDGIVVKLESGSSLKATWAWYTGESSDGFHPAHFHPGHFHRGARS